MERCTRTPKGILFTLAQEEVELLCFLNRELSRLLEDGDPQQGILKPFHPLQKQGDDPEAVSHDLEESINADLLIYRLNRIQEIQKELLPPDHQEGDLSLLLDDALLDMWLGYLNDVRLLLAAVIGITEEHPNPPEDQDPEEWTIDQQLYMFLTGLQDLFLSLL